MYVTKNNIKKNINFNRTDVSNSIVTTSINININDLLLESTKMLGIPKMLMSNSYN